jgi:hypothetical protein
VFAFHTGPQNAVRYYLPKGGESTLEGLVGFTEGVLIGQAGRLFRSSPPPLPGEDKDGAVARVVSLTFAERVRNNTEQV